MAEAARLRMIELFYAERDASTFEARERDREMIGELGKLQEAYPDIFWSLLYFISSNYWNLPLKKS